jgi:hypothetical protein
MHLVPIFLQQLAKCDTFGGFLIPSQGLHQNDSTDSFYKVFVGRGDIHSGWLKKKCISQYELYADSIAY